MKKLSNKIIARINHNMEAIRQHQVNHPETSVRMLTVSEMKDHFSMEPETVDNSHIIRLNNLLK